MARIKLTLIFIFLVTTELSAQKTYPTKYEVQYEVSFSMDSLHLDDRKKETTYLYTGSDYGVFMSSKVAKADEINASIERQMRSGSVTITSDMISDFNKTFYKNLQTGTVKTVEDIARKDYIYKEPKTPTWTISDSTKTFQDYAVQKATTRFAGRNYVAWFTMEIPIHDGPYLFSGLPGLIVELYDTRRDYHFKLKSIQKLDAPKTWTLPKAESIEKAKFKKRKAKAAKNADNDVIQMGNMTIRVVETDDMSQEEKMDNKKVKRQQKKKFRGVNLNTYICRIKIFSYGFV